MRCSEPGLNWRAFSAAVLVVALTDAAAYLLNSRLSGAGVIVFVAPLFGGMVAGWSRVRPVILGMLAPLLGNALVLGVASAAYEWYGHPTVEQSEDPTGVLLGSMCYTAILGAIGAWITSRARSPDPGALQNEAGSDGDTREG